MAPSTAEDHKNGAVHQSCGGGSAEASRRWIFFIFAPRSGARGEEPRGERSALYYRVLHGECVVSHDEVISSS